MYIFFYIYNLYVLHICLFMYYAYAYSLRKQRLNYKDEKLHNMLKEHKFPEHIIYIHNFKLL